MNFPMNKNEFEESSGPIRHLNGSSLKRPSKMPLAFRGIAAIFVTVAVVIGGIFLFNVTDEVVNAPLREAEATQANLDRDVLLDLPLLKNLIQLDDTTIMTGFTDAGLTIYETSPLEMTEEGTSNGFEIVKLPPDVSVAEAGIYYLQGVSSLSSADAARLLNGSWTMGVSRSGGVNMNVKYADFSSGSLEAAVQNAIIAEELDVEGSSFGESGVDGAGNTYQEGTININGTVYTWRVSTVWLSDFYAISGLPETAVYVGIRMY